MMRILMVENHARFAKTVTREFLRAHEVRVVPSISEARVMLERREFDAYLVDYDLDDGKGTQFVRWLRAREPDGLIVAMSAHKRGNDALVDAGATVACPKMEFSPIARRIDEAAS